MRPGEWTLRGRQVVTPTGTRAADILIRGETIEGFRSFEDPESEGVILDVGELLVLPGLVDLHVHVQEPSREEAEGFETATRAAAAGGVTTLVDLPTLNWPMTVNSRNLGAKLASASGKLWVDTGFFGGLVATGFSEVVALLDAGTLGILTVLGPSTDDFTAATPADYRQAIPRLVRAGRPLLVMDPGPDRKPPTHSATNGRSPQVGGGRAVESIRELVALCREFRCRVHLMGFSTVETLPGLADARAEGLPITVETCPHLLVFGTDRDRLWDALRSGLIDSIASGHRPTGAPSEGGHRPNIASLQTAVSAVWTEARGRGFTPDDLVRWMAGRPSEIVGISTRKGSIVAGADADFVIFDADSEFVVDPNHLFHRHPATPFEGRTLSGQVAATFLRGRLVFESGRFHGEAQGIALLKLEETLPLLRGLDRLNELSEIEAVESLRACCGSNRWASRVLALRPFANEVDLLDAADRVWMTLDQGDQIEAVAAEPRISDREAHRESPSHTNIGSADLTCFEIPVEAIYQSLIDLDHAYETKFGHRFVLEHPDQPAIDLHGEIQARLSHDPETELRVTTQEMSRMIRRRIQALVV